MRINSMTTSFPPDLAPAINDWTEKWQKEQRTASIWAKEASVWTDDDEAKWLGWLHVVEEQLELVESYRELQADIASAGFEEVLLMGMGGSSLCPEVLAMTFGKMNFHILDSTVPAQVKAVEAKLDLEKTLFIVASKSGSTLEPNCFKQYFFEKLAEKVGRENAGRQFTAITDPGSKMEKVAREDGFRHIIYGKPEIGGRFSALSAFGMTAAAAMGIDVESFLKSSARMVEACRSNDPNSNPGAILGLLLGVCHAHGRDKLTIFTTKEIHDLGAWLEQLVAESTGKNGVSIIPVDREAALPADVYGDDRVFAFLSVVENDSLDEQFTAVTAAGHPAVRIELNSIDDLGQEFFRWEFATAVAGSVMGINPFNQPDVEAAKIESRKITDEYEKTGSLPFEKPFHEEDEIKLFLDASKTEVVLGYAHCYVLKDFLDAFIDGGTAPNNYFAILAYVEMEPRTEKLVQAIREIIMFRTGMATCVGFGPRFLHSTGQAYKGGANNGVFLQITSEDAFDLEVPQQKYTFGVVKAAQARGDFQVLIDRGRRALRVHLGINVTNGLERIVGNL